MKKVTFYDGDEEIIKEVLIIKKSTIELIKEKFQKDIYQIDAEIRKNKKEINKLATKQKQLKDTKTGLHEILQLIK